MASPLERAAIARKFNERLKEIASKHRTLQDQRGAVAELVREMGYVGSSAVIADLLEGTKIPTELSSRDQDMWVAYELYRVDGLSYEEGINKVAGDFFKSPKTVEAAINKAKKAGREIL